MPDVIINFKAQVSGQDEVQQALVQQGKLEKEVVNGANAATKAFSDQAKAISGVGAQTDKLAASMKAIPKSIVGGGAREFQELAKQIKSGEAQIDAFATATGIAKKRLQELNPASDAYKRIQAELKASVVANENLNKSFTSSRGELRAMRETLLQLEDAGLDGTKVFENLAVEAGKLEDAAGDAQARIKTLASDTFKFDAALQAVQGVTAGFAVLQGAAALFGEENEEIQRTLLKVNAAMSILSGLQSLQNALQKQTALYIASENALRAISVVQTNLQTAAESKNIVVRYAAIAAQKALNAVMSLNPAGAVLLAIGALATALIVLTRNTDNQADAQNELNEALKISVEQTNLYVGAIRNAGDVIAAQLEAQGASEREIRQARIANLRAQLVEQEKAYRRTSENFAKANEDYRRKVDQEIDISDEERKARQDAYDIANDAAEAYFETQRAIEIAELNNIRDTNKERAALQKEAADNAKKAAEQRQKDIEKFLDDQIAANEIALSESRNSFERIVAQIEVINARLRRALADPNLSPNQRVLAEIKAGEEIKKARQAEFGDLERVETNKSILTKKLLQDEFLARAQANQLRLQDEQSQAQARIRIAEDEARKRAEIQARLQELSVNTALTLATSLNEISRNQAENELAILQDKLDRGLISEKQFEQEQRVIRRRAAAQEKELALFQASIAQSLAVLSVLKDQTIPVPLKPVFIALTVAQAIAQLAAIASRPIPAFKKGTKSAPGGPSLIGEAGAELYYQNGQWGYAPHATVLDLQPGAKVFTAKETDKILRDYNVPIPGLPRDTGVMTTGYDIDYNKIGRVIGNEIGKLPLNHWTFDERGVTVRQEKAARRKNYQQSRYNSGRV